MGHRNYIWATWAHKMYPATSPESWLQFSQTRHKKSPEPWLEFSQMRPHFLKNNEMNPEISKS